MHESDPVITGWVVADPERAEARARKYGRQYHGFDWIENEAECMDSAVWPLLELSALLPTEVPPGLKRGDPSDRIVLRLEGEQFDRRTTRWQALKEWESAIERTRRGEIRAREAALYIARHYRTGELWQRVHDAYGLICAAYNDGTLQFWPTSIEHERDSFYDLSYGDEQKYTRAAELNRWIKASGVVDPCIDFPDLSESGAPKPAKAETKRRLSVLELRTMAIRAAIIAIGEDPENVPRDRGGRPNKYSEKRTFKSRVMNELKSPTSGSAYEWGGDFTEPTFKDAWAAFPKHGR